MVRVAVAVPPAVGLMVVVMVVAGARAGFCRQPSAAGRGDAEFRENGYEAKSFGETSHLKLEANR